MNNTHYLDNIDNNTTMTISRYISYLLILMQVLGLSSCQSTAIIGSGHIISDNRPVEGIRILNLGGYGELHLMLGNSESLTIIAEDNIIPYLQSEVNEGGLTVGNIDTVSWTRIKPTVPIQYYLTVRKIDELIVSGWTSLFAESITSDVFHIECSGNGQIIVNLLITKNLKIDASGSGILSIGGEATNQEIDLSGNSQYNAGELKSTDIKLSMSGSSIAFLWAEHTLELSLSGNGELSYFGFPGITQNNSGSTTITSLGEK